MPEHTLTKAHLAKLLALSKLSLTPSQAQDMYQHFDQLLQHLAVVADAKQTNQAGEELLHSTLSPTTQSLMREDTATEEPYQLSRAACYHQQEQADASFVVPRVLEE